MIKKFITAFLNFLARGGADSPREITFTATFKETGGKMEKLDFKRPVGEQYPISSRMGERTIDGIKEFHNGYDFAVPVGTPVLAGEDGAAFRCGWQDEINPKVGYGLRVWQEIEVTDGTTKKRFYVWYGHLSKILIKEGDRIKKGQEIGFSGHTGRSTGPHLHVGARERDTSKFMEINFV